MGHWATGVMIPDRYDKAVCATELKLRARIFTEIPPGRRPRHALQVSWSGAIPNTQTTGVGDVGSDISETPAAPQVKEERANDITELVCK